MSITTTYSNPTLRGDVVCWAQELGIWCAIGIDDDFVCRSHISVDGVNWTDPSEVPLGNANDICWSADAGVFLVVGNNGGDGDGAYSFDGITWTAIPDLGVHNSPNGCCFAPDLGMFVVVGQSSVDSKSTSFDAVTWTSQGATAGDNWRSVAWSPTLGMLVAVGDNDADDHVITSPDGSTWTPQGSAFVAPTAFGTDVIWSSDLALFVAVGSGDNDPLTQQIITSPDATTWTGQGAPWGLGSMFGSAGGLVVGYGFFLGAPLLKAYGANLAGVFKEFDSADGTTWVEVTNPFSGVGGRMLGISSKTDVFLEVGRDDTVPASAARIADIPTPPTGQKLYAARAQFRTTSDLYTIDIETGVCTSIGPIGNSVTGLAFDATTGIMYAVTPNRGIWPQSLLEINLVTGAGTLIGELDGGSGEGLGDICCSPGGDLYGLGNDTAGLWSINKETGQMTFIGNPDGMDRYGGACSFIGAVMWAFPYAEFGPITNLATGAWDHVGSTDDILAGATTNSEDDTMFAINTSEGLFTINLVTGEQTLLATLDVTDMDAIEWTTPTLLTQYARIYGWTLNISDDALETVDPLLVSPAS